MLSEISILFHHGKQFIPNLALAQVPAPFRGRPVITSAPVDTGALVDVCPTNAIASVGQKVSIDLGKCLFCGECALAFPEKISFTNDHKLASNDRQRLIIHEGSEQPITLDPDRVRAELRAIFGRSLKLRQISAAGDNSFEAELNACGIGQKTADVGADDADDDIHDQAHVGLGELLGNPASHCANQQGSNPAHAAAKIHQIVHFILLPTSGSG